MPWHMSAPRAVSCCPHDPIRVSFPYLPEGMGWPQKFCSNVAFLLALPQEGAVGERVYGFTMVWVHPYQAGVSTIDDVARQLAQLSFTGSNWPYALVQLNGDALMCPSLQRVTWVWWWRGILAMSFVWRSANWRFTNFWAQAPKWFTLKDSTGVKFQW